MTNTIQLITEIIQSIESQAAFSAKDIGNILDIVSDRVYRVRPFNQSATQVLVNEVRFPLVELNYYFKDIEFALSDLTETLGGFSIHYNHRENYTEFRFGSTFKRIKKIYLIKENRIDPIDQGRFIEVTPRSEEHLITSLTFNLISMDVEADK
jgi:hypothetical protein